MIDFKRTIASVLILFTTVFHLLHAQPPEISIKGQAYSEKKGLSFVNIYLKGTMIGTATDENGYFQLTGIKDGNYIIVAKSLGYINSEKEITVKSRHITEVKFELVPDVFMIDQIVVTANRNEIKRSEAVVMVNTITPKLFEATQSVSLAEGINYTPGLRMENNCQNCGFSQLRINGLEGPYTQVLLNSRPIFSGLAGVYGLEQIPANMIERIEVVRGGGSALFGGNAIAGTVNIITREPIANTFSVGANYGLVNGETPDATISFNGSVVSSDYKSGIHLFGALRNRSPFNANPNVLWKDNVNGMEEKKDDFSEITLVRNRVMGFMAYYKPTNYSKISLDFHSMNEFRRGGNKFDKMAHEADIAEQVHHNILGGGITYEMFSKRGANKMAIYIAGQNVNRDSYYGAEQDPDAYGRSQTFSVSAGMQIAGNIEKAIFAPSIITIGIENKFEKLNDEKLGSARTPNTLIADQKLNTLGTYLQNEWQFSRSKLGIGLRYDIYTVKDHNSESENLSGQVLCPRINFMHQITEISNFRISLSKGYRAPQIFDEDLHIETSGARKVVHVNSSDLKQETSYSLSGSLEFMPKIRSIQTLFMLEGFYTVLLSPFANEFVMDDSTGIAYHYRVNADKGAYVTGINTEIKLMFKESFDLQAGFTAQKSMYQELIQWGNEDGSVSDKILRTPATYGFLTANWGLKEKFFISLSGLYTGRMHVPHLAGGTNPGGQIITQEKLEYTPHFFDLGIRFSYDFHLTKTICLTVYVGAKNILNSYQSDFDAGLYRDAGYVYGPGQPFTPYLGIKIGEE